MVFSSSLTLPERTHSPAPDPFIPDPDGRLVNTAGYYLMGYDVGQWHQQCDGERVCWTNTGKRV